MSRLLFLDSFMGSSLVLTHHLPRFFFGNVAIFWKGRVYRLAVTQFKADYLVWVGVLLKSTVIMVIISKFKAFTNILKFIYFGVLASF